MNSIAEVITNWLIKQNTISSNERELYEYAILCLFSFIFPITFSLVIGSFIGLTGESLFMIIPFIFIRKFAGGYHSKYLTACLLESSAVIVAVLLLADSVESSVSLNVVAFLAALLLICFSPVDSENRKLAEDEKRICKKCTIIIAFFFIAMQGLMQFVGFEGYAKYIAVGIILSSILQILAIVHKILKGNQES